MSIVGYVVGLGDRHGENILFDDSCGDCVHVDLNCLFEKGQTFEVPERVPFRLTHNLVDAMGVTGVEGVFRKSCEVTINVLRKNRESLMSVLETFLYDPLCEWSKGRRNSQLSPEGGEAENELALRSLKSIDRKLRGYTLSAQKAGFPLSNEGQVNELIQQATNLENLSRMYIGWAAFM
jgi:serine/threonine-protein kinase ATR